MFLSIWLPPLESYRDMSSQKADDVIQCGTIGQHHTVHLRVFSILESFLKHPLTAMYCDQH